MGLFVDLEMYHQVLGLSRWSGCFAREQFVSVIASIRKKLVSLAGIALVVNQVLLGTPWHIASCWCFSQACIKKLQRLIRFLWVGSGGTTDMRRVSWDSIIGAWHEGGLEIIDLSKLIVKGLTPGDHPWKCLLQGAGGRCR